eukprot:Awhi_evm1s9313
MKLQQKRPAKEAKQYSSKRKRLSVTYPQASSLHVLKGSSKSQAIATGSSSSSTLTLCKEKDDLIQKKRLTNRDAEKNRRDTMKMSINNL